MSKNTLILVLREGGDFNEAHALALHRAVQAHSTVGVHTLLLTDSNSGALRSEKHLTAEPLLHNWGGWWAKLEMFRPDLSLSTKGMTVFMDLDTVITGNVDALWDTSPFTMLSDFYHPRWASGLMAWFPCAKNKPLVGIYERFLEDPVTHSRQFRVKGDQAFIQDCLKDSKLQPVFWQDRMPGKVISYKVHVRPTAVLPEEADVVCFHGKPRPWELMAVNWAKRQYVPPQVTKGGKDA